MLGKLLGITPQKSALPKNQIEVVCPVCGAAQREPRLVVTTVCRQCGEHLRIEKRRVIASSQINPVPSAIYPAVNAAEQPPYAPGAEPDVQAQVPNALLPENPLDEDIPPGMGNLIMGVENPPDETPAPVPKSTPFTVAPDTEPPSESLQPSANNQETESAAEEFAPENEESSTENENVDPSLPADSAPPSQRGTFRRFQPTRRAQAVRPEPSTFQKMREQGFRQQHFKEVECFDCHHKFKVGRSARNSQCPACSSSICLEDIDINVTSTAPIRTRGDVYIRKMGNVSTSEIKCRDLNIQGIISANVECTGELTIRTAGTIVGEIHCVRLHIIKGSDIQLVNTIYAREVEIYARVCGNIHCEGPVLIGSGGCVEGSVTARSVNIEPGGHLDGGMNILRPAPKKPSVNPEGDQAVLPLEEEQGDTA